MGEARDVYTIFLIKHSTYTAIYTARERGLSIMHMGVLLA